MEPQNPVTCQMSETSFTTSTSNPRGEDSFSVFSDGCCGEPLIAQHLVVDFTPNEQLDNDFVQRKCCAFWEFINQQPELQGLMAMPEPNLYRPSYRSDTSSEVETTQTLEAVQPERTAVSMLEIVEEKGLIDRTFEAKLPQSHCSLGSREYPENSSLLPVKASSSKTNSVCICSGSCKTCQLKPSKVSLAASSAAAMNLCRKMQDWDDNHPKCMDPPGHPPLLTCMRMQRKIV